MNDDELFAVLLAASQAQTDKVLIVEGSDLPSGHFNEAQELGLIELSTLEIAGHGVKLSNERALKLTELKLNRGH